MKQRIISDFVKIKALLKTISIIFLNLTKMSSYKAHWLFVLQPIGSFDFDIMYNMINARWDKFCNLAGSCTEFWKEKTENLKISKFFSCKFGELNSSIDNFQLFIWSAYL